MADTFTFKPIRELAGLIAGRQVSPVELTQAFLDRLEQYGPYYNALVTLTAERALATAHRAESDSAAGRNRGLLQGIPWGAKDLLATSGGIPTTWGAAPFKDQQFDYDATVVNRLEAAGAPLAGKLANHVEPLPTVRRIRGDEHGPDGHVRTQPGTGRPYRRPASLSRRADPGRPGPAGTIRPLLQRPGDAYRRACTGYGTPGRIGFSGRT